VKKLVAVSAAAVCGLFALLVASALAAVGTPAGDATPSGRARADIPTQLLPIYRSAAATCPGLSWAVLAAIGKVESDHGRSRAPGVTSGENSAGAGGPMQFLSATWAAYGVDGNGDGDIDRYSPADAIFGAANYLCHNGAGKPSRLRSAIFAYNHADWYVDKVLDQARAYAGKDASWDAASLLSNPRLGLSANARADLVAGIVDSRLVSVLAQLLTRHTLYMGVFKTGHPTMIVTDNGPGNRVSMHYYGRAADIMAVDGVNVSRANPAARAVVVELKTLLAGQSYELGQPWADLVGGGTFTNAVHQNHIHIGFLTAGG
jgi:hypothetical protein